MAERVDASAGRNETGIVTAQDDGGSVTLLLPAGVVSHLGSELLPQLAAHFANVEAAWSGLAVGQGATSQSLVPMLDGRQAWVRIRVDVRDNRGAQAAEDWLAGWEKPNTP